MPAGFRLPARGRPDPAELWRVPLCPTDQYALERAFERDPELWRDVGCVLTGLVDLGVREVFVNDFVTRIRAAGPGASPAVAVLPAALTALEAVR